MLALELATKVDAPMVYRTAFAAIVLALDAVAAASATLCAAAVALLDAETENEASLTTLAETVSSLEADAENAPIQTRSPLNAAVLVAAKVTAPRLTP